MTGFIADASHQLRTPLTVLKTQAELALRERNTAAMHDIVRSIAGTTDATIHLANRLLTLERIENGGAGGERVPLALAEVARQVGLELAVAAVHKLIDLALEADPGEDTMLRGQVLLLHELASNLVDNAIRHTPAGGSVLLQVRRQGSVVELVVQDSGPGFAPGECDKVFMPFYPAAATMESNSAGTGLGLAIVRDIAVLQDATIRLADADAGRGLRISVALPAMSAPVHS